MHGSQWLRVAAGAQSGLLCGCIAIGLELCWGCPSWGRRAITIICFRSTDLLGPGVTVVQKSHGFLYWAV